MTKPPRIAVALGGGSARGLAHIGVLRWLEEHRVPVDAVAGTSMGAFIGAAYATGMSPDEIQGIFKNENWEVTLQRDFSYGLKSFRRKEDDLAFPVKLDVGLRHGLRLQSGLNSGHRMGLMLSRVFLPYSTVERFDDLATPFRAVATDLEAGESVVLDHGSLASALRASMALPGTFDPVEIDGKLLADGGILNNNPVDVAKAMGADVVIAVSVSAPRRDRPDESIQGVANRAIRLMMQDLDRPRLEQADVVVLPDVEGVRASAFQETDDLVARGYAGAEAQSALLLRYAVDQSTWDAHQRNRRERRQPRTARVTRVEVLGVSGLAAEQIARRVEEELALSTAGHAATLDSQLDWVIGHGRYASAMYRRATKDGADRLVLDFRDKSYAPPLLKFALDLDNENKDINLAFGARTTFMDITSAGSEVRFDLSAGSTMRVGAELFQPLFGSGSMRRGLFIAPHARYVRTTENVYLNEDLTAIYNRHRAGAGVDLGWLFGRTTQVRFGFDTDYVRNAVRLGDPVPESRGAERSLRMKFDYKGQDRAYSATRGVRLSTTGTWLLKTPEVARAFGRVEGSLNAAFRTAPQQHVTFYADGGATLGDQPPPVFYQFTLGGPFRLGGLAPDSLRGKHFVLGGVAYRAQLSRLPSLLGDRIYATALVEVGSAFDRFARADFKSSLTAGVSADTFFGPLFVGATLGGSGSVRAYFVVGSQIR